MVNLNQNEKLEEIVRIPGVREIMDYRLGLSVPVRVTDDMTEWEIVLLPGEGRIFSLSGDTGLPTKPEKKR